MFNTMAFNDNMSFAGSQPDRQAIREALPIYEPNSSPQLGNVMSQNHTNTDLPPPYATLDTESYLSDWVLDYSLVFWSRTVKRRGKIWCQYSLKKNDLIPRGGNGRSFFTCGMQPREGHSDRSVRRICEDTIIALRVHRCDCLFCNVQHIQTGGCSCVPNSSGCQLKYSMVQHDAVCSCGCFDAPSPPRRALNMRPVWESEARNGQFYWFRTIRQYGQPLFQCGINTNEGNRRYGEEPNLVFACKMMPRVGHTKSSVAETCKAVALALKTHRTVKGEECNVCDFRHVQGKRIGCPAAIFSTSRARFLHKMRSHDEACGCRCFHVDRHGRPTISESSRNPQLQTGTERQLENGELDVQEDSVYRAWEFVPARFSQVNFYWTRMIKDGDQIWHQYGVSERQSDGRPEFFFTCQMKPREGKSEQVIREVCKEVASAMRAHRSADYNRCTCNFQTWRNRGGSGGCHVSWYHLNTRMIRSIISVSMRHHDRLCLCGCFDIGRGEDADTSGQWLRD